MKPNSTRSSKARRAGTALAMALGTATLLAACGGSSNDDNTVAAPTPPAAPALADTIAARQHYFGKENVDKTTGSVRADQVIFSWLSNTTFAGAINGQVVLMDASLLRREAAPGRTPTTLKEMIALKPSHIFLSLAAPGHADLAANIAFSTGATLVGAEDHCAVLQADARKQFAPTTTADLLTCVSVAPRAAAVGTALPAFKLAAIGACVRPVKNSLSRSVAADRSVAASTFDWGAGTDTRETTLWPVGAPANDGVSTSGLVDSPALLYHFTLDGAQRFGFAWSGHAGSFKEDAPQVATALRQLPKTDVYLGSVATDNAVNNGLRDPALYIANVEPKIFYPAGQDAAAQQKGAFANTELVRRALQASLANVGVTDARLPDVRFLYDPSDYTIGTLMAFDPAAPAWTRATDRIAGADCK